MFNLIKLNGDNGVIKPGKGMIKPGKGMIKPGDSVIKPSKGVIKPGNGVIKPSWNLSLHPAQTSFKYLYCCYQANFF